MGYKWSHQGLQKVILKLLCKNQGDGFGLLWSRGLGLRLWSSRWRETGHCMAPICSDGSNHKCLGEQNHSVGGDRDCVHRGSEAAHGIQKPEQKSESHWNSQGHRRKETRFSSSVELERFKPGPSRSTKDREAPAGIWIILQVIVINLKSKYH